MAKIFFTADTHFNHEGIIRFCHRPFFNADEMDEVLIANWNAVVYDTDIIYHLGDWCFGNGKKKNEVGARLNGYKHLIRGSHDKQIPDGIFESISDAKMIRPNINGLPQGIYMSHYCHKVWDESHYGSWHLFGHSHGRLDEYASNEGKMMDVGVDTTIARFMPISLEQVIKVMDTRPSNWNDIHRRNNG